MRDALLGMGLTVAVGAVAYWGWGRDAAIACAAFGCFAVALHLPATGLFRRGLAGSFDRTLGHWIAGLGIRLAGVLVFMVVVTVAPERFPALPAAIGFLGVLVPLLFFEMRLLR